MKISAMSIAFRSLYRSEMEITDFIRYCAQAGLDGVEISSVDEEGIEQEVDQALQETGLAVCSYNCRAGFLGCSEREMTSFVFKLMAKSGTYC